MAAYAAERRVSCARRCAAPVRRGRATRTAPWRGPSEHDQRQVAPSPVGLGGTIGESGRDAAGPVHVRAGGREGSKQTPVGSSTAGRPCPRLETPISASLRAARARLRVHGRGAPGGRACPAAKKQPCPERRRSNSPPDTALRLAGHLVHGTTHPTPMLNRLRNRTTCPLRTGRARSFLDTPSLPTVLREMASPWASTRSSRTTNRGSTANSMPSAGSPSTLNGAGPAMAWVRTKAGSFVSKPTTSMSAGRTRRCTLWFQR